jgi:hypothetical protein
MVPADVVEIVPAAVVEIVPLLFVVEMVPANALEAITRVNIRVLAADLKFFMTSSPVLTSCWVGDGVYFAERLIPDYVNNCSHSDLLKDRANTPRKMSLVVTVTNYNICGTFLRVGSEG